MENADIRLHILRWVGVGSRLVSKQWCESYDDGLIQTFPDMSGVFRGIVQGNHRTMSFEECYRIVYNMCISKQTIYVLMVLARVCSKWPMSGNVDAIASLCEGICLYLKTRVSPGLIRRIVCDRYLASSSIL